jgi:microsomal dipeptidase-like Zn-dependent dipeptidase
MRHIHYPTALSAAVLVFLAHATSLLAQVPKLLPGQPVLGPTVGPALPPATPQPVAQPVVRPGEITPVAVPLVIPNKNPEVADLRARGAAPTQVRVTATSPFAVAVEWQLPPCAQGSSIRVGTPGGKSRVFYQSDTLPPSKACGTGTAIKTGRMLRVAGETPTFTTSSLSSQNLEPLQPATTYVVTVDAFYRDSASGGAEPVTVTMPPPPPFTIAAVNAAANLVDISWNPAVRASKYVVFRDNVQLADVGTGQSYQDRTVKPITDYVYRVDAVYAPVYTGQSYSGAPPVTISATANVKTPYPVVFGFADTHTHPFANLAAGGALFWGSAFGPIDAALGVCDPAHGWGGTGDVVGNIKAGFRIGHHTGGYPNFDGWPTWNTLDHQQMYSDWIYRAYQGGLRLMVSHAVNNGLICSIVNHAPGRSCDDMEAVDLQIQAAKDMEASIDQQSGGAGRGWFRIAYTPQQARQIILDGKLAVVLGIEVDKLFNCGMGQCDSATVSTKLAEYYNKGVRHLYPVHFADNAFGGYALGGGTEKFLFGLNSTAAQQNGLLGFTIPQDEDCSSRFAQKCNQRHLTPLGAHLIRAMMNKGMIIDIDHMGMHTTDDVLALTTPRHYPVISGHTGFVGTAMPGHSSERDKSDAWLATMKTDGGMVSVGVTPGQAQTYTPSWRGAVPNDCDGTTKTFAQGYLYAIDKMGGPNVAAVGLATDQFLNELTGPRFDNHCGAQNPATKVAYPFTTRTGVSLGKSHSGNRDFDYNTEGMAHFGLLADFVQDLKNDGLTDHDLDPLFRSAEGYIRLWERAVASVPTP